MSTSFSYPYPSRSDWAHRFNMALHLISVALVALVIQISPSTASAASFGDVPILQIQRNADAVVELIPGVAEQVTGVVLISIEKSDVFVTNMDPHETFRGPGPMPARIGGGVMVVDRLESPTPSRQPDTVLDMYARIDLSKITTPEEFCDALNGYASGYVAFFHQDSGKIVIWDESLPPVIRERLETPVHEFLDADQNDRARATKGELLTALHERVGYLAKNSRAFEREIQPQEFVKDDGQRDVAPARWSSLDHEFDFRDVSRKTALDVMLLLLRSEDGEGRNRSHCISVSDPQADFSSMTREQVVWQSGITGCRPEREALSRVTAARD